MKSTPGIQEAHTTSFLRGRKQGLDLLTTGHEVNIETEECWQSNKRKHLRRPWQSPRFAFHMFACWHTIKAGAAHSSHIKFFHLPHKRKQSKQANISFPRARAHGRPGHSGLPVARQNLEPTIRLGARHICSGFHSRGCWFSHGRRAGDGHLASSDGEEQSGTVSHDWLEHQPNGDGPPLTLLSLPRGRRGTELVPHSSLTPLYKNSPILSPRSALFLLCGTPAWPRGRFQQILKILLLVR